MVDIMQRFSTQNIYHVKHTRHVRAYFFSSIGIPFSYLSMVHEMPLRQKEAYAPPLESTRAKHSQ